MKVVPEHMIQRFREEYRALQAERMQMAEAEQQQRAAEEDCGGGASSPQKPNARIHSTTPLADVGNAQDFQHHHQQQHQHQQRQLDELQARASRRGYSGGAESASLSMLQMGGQGGREVPALPRQGRKHVQSRAASSSIGSLLSGIDEH